MSTMKERMARASHLAYYGEPFDKESQPEKDDWRRMVDAILRELMEPSAEVSFGAFFPLNREASIEAWQVTLQQLLDEPQQEDDAA